jgi:hypothetical protein
VKTAQTPLDWASAIRFKRDRQASNVPAFVAGADAVLAHGRQAKLGGFFIADSSKTRRIQLDGHALFLQSMPIGCCASVTPSVAWSMTSVFSPKKAQKGAKQLISQENPFHWTLQCINSQYYWLRCCCVRGLLSLVRQLLAIARLV